MTVMEVIKRDWKVMAVSWIIGFVVSAVTTEILDTHFATLCLNLWGH